jgi:hypothetical protein
VRKGRRQFLKGSLAVVASHSLVDAAGAASNQKVAGEPTPESSRKTVLFMDDSDVLQYTPYPMTREQLANYIGFLANGGIDILSWNVNLNGACWYGTKVGVGIYEGPQEFAHYAPRHTAANVQHLVEIGADPPAVVAAECHRRGMRMVARFGPGLARFSEEDFRLGSGVYYNKFAQSHPEFTIQKVNPQTAGWGVKPGMHLDYTHSEVREWLLRPMQEVAERYDVDGLDLFFRGGAYFESDEAVNKAPIMTEFIAAVRKILDQAARKRGRERLMLCVAVPDRLRWATLLGLDVDAWIKKRLVDIVMPCRVHGLDFEAPVEEFVASCNGTPCRVLPTLQPGIPPHQFPYTLPQLRAAVDNWDRAGAEGFSTFNFHHRYQRHLGGDTCLSLSEALTWLRDLREPERGAAGVRVFPFYRYAEITRLENPQLSFAPSDLGVRKTVSIPRVRALSAPGGKRTLRFIADEIAWDDLLEVDIDGNRLKQDSMRFEVEGTILGAISGKPIPYEEREVMQWPCYRYEFEIPRQQSYGVVGIRLVKRCNVRSDIKIRDIEIVISGNNG